MTDTQVVEVVVGALQMALKMAAPVLAVALVVGVLASLLQTITQIQEQALTFVPKLVGVGLVLVIGGNWMIREMVRWVTDLWQTIPTLG